MKYIFLAYADEKQWDTLSSSERDALGDACQANDQALRERGYLLAVEGLHSSCTATVRVQNSKVFITDGPVAETNEQLIGIFTINARDLNEAIQLAATIPPARVGSIEVRPVRELSA